jgi:hypothetical protein
MKSFALNVLAFAVVIVTAVPSFAIFGRKNVDYQIQPFQIPFHSAQLSLDSVKFQLSCYWRKMHYLNDGDSDGPNFEWVVIHDQVFGPYPLEATLKNASSEYVLSNPQVLQLKSSFNEHTDELSCYLEFLVSGVQTKSRIKRNFELYSGFQRHESSGNVKIIKNGDVTGYITYTLDGKQPVGVDPYLLQSVPDGQLEKGVISIQGSPYEVLQVIDGRRIYDRERQVVIEL